MVAVNNHFKPCVLFSTTLPLDFPPFRTIIENGSQIRIRKKSQELHSKDRKFATRSIDLRRILAAAVCMVLLFVLLFSISYVMLESDHDCCGEDCHVCECLEACGNALSLFRCGSGTGADTAVAAYAVFFVFALGLVSFVLGRETPVTDKIRLNI